MRWLHQFSRFLLQPLRSGDRLCGDLFVRSELKAFEVMGIVRQDGLIDNSC